MVSYSAPTKSFSFTSTVPNKNSTSSTANANIEKLKQTALELSKTQLENSRQQADWSFGYRSKEKSQDDQITRRQMEEQYGFQRGLVDQQNAQQYGFQRGINDQQNAFQYSNNAQNDEITRRQMQEQYGFQRGINDQQNVQQTAMQNNQYNQERTMFNAQDLAQQRNTQSSRDAANTLYFGRAKNRPGFQGRR